MSWNYRIVRRDDDGIVSFGIHEAYFEEDGSCFAITEEPVKPYGETWDELYEDLSAMASAVGKPVLDYETRRPV